MSSRWSTRSRSLWNPLLRLAWARLVARHPILRTSFRWEGIEEPLQDVHLSADLPWREEDWRGLRDEEILMAAVEGNRERYYREILQPMKLRGYRDYLEKRSWRSDLRVLLETVPAVFRSRPGHPAPLPPDLYRRPPRA